MKLSGFAGRFAISSVVALISAAGFYLTPQGKDVVVNIINRTQGESTGIDSIVEDSNQASSEKKPQVIQNNRSNDKPNFSVSYPQKTEESGLISCTVNGCASSGSTVRMSFILLNKDVDKNLHLNRARIIDNNGYEYQSYKLDIARSGNRFFELPSHVPVKVEVVFDEIENIPEHIEIFELSGNAGSGNREDFEIAMRDLPVR